MSNIIKQKLFAAPRLDKYLLSNVYLCIRKENCSIIECRLNGTLKTFKLNFPPKAGDFYAKHSQLTTSWTLVLLISAVGIVWVS